MHRARAAAILIALVWVAPAAGQRTKTSYEIVVDAPRTVEEVLRRQAGKGFACAAVARPAGVKLSTNVAVIVGQPAPAFGAAGAADISVVTATAHNVVELEKRLNAAAQQGFGLCGITLTAAIWGQPSDYAVVAVLTRMGTAPTGSAYRVIRSRGRREEWTQVEQAAADGFVVSRLVSVPRPDPSSSNTSDIVFVAEKTAASRPTRYEMAFAGNGPALEKEIKKSTDRGHCVQAAWATAERLTVLLARPIDAACDRPHDYEIEEPSSFVVDNVGGELLGLFRIKDGAMGLYNNRGSAVDYSIIEGVLTDPESRPVVTPSEQRRLTEKLDVDGGRGYRPLDVTWRDAGSGGRRAVDIVLSRPRQ